MPSIIVSPELMRFATELRQRIGASRILVFGSHARGDAQCGSDVDVIVVAEHFRDIERPRRAVGLRSLWYASGGDAPMDLICLTPAEFDRARACISLVAAVLPEAVEL